MKTLDEVIEILERQIDKTRIKILDKDLLDSVPDALHYLRLFQKHVERVRGQLDALKEEYRPNEPLDWETLKTMEGKPVWVEDGLENGEWYIIECFTDSGRFIGHDRYADDTVFKAVDMGNEWQAYRKERTDGKA